MPYVSHRVFSIVRCLKELTRPALVVQVREPKRPDCYTKQFEKKYTNKIFIDWICNIRKRAGVSMPIGRDETGQGSSRSVIKTEALWRIGAHDPWYDSFRNRQQLK